jgi:hypothetical protein
MRVWGKNWPEHFLRDFIDGADLSGGSARDILGGNLYYI